MSQTRMWHTGAGAATSGGGGVAICTRRHRLRSGKRRQETSVVEENNQATMASAASAAAAASSDHQTITSMNHQLASRLGGFACSDQDERNDERQRSCRRRQLPCSTRFLLCNSKSSSSSLAQDEEDESDEFRVSTMYSSTSRRRRRSTSTTTARVSRYLRRCLVHRSPHSAKMSLMTTIALFLILAIVSATTSSSSNHQHLAAQALASTPISSDQSISSASSTPFNNLQLGPSLWFQRQQQQQQQPQLLPQRPPKLSAQNSAPEPSQDATSDSFGSRLLVSASAQVDARRREDDGAIATTTTTADENAFMKRQGQLGAPPSEPSEPSRVRQARQPAPQRQGNLMTMQQQQQQQQQQQRSRQQLAGLPPGSFGAPSFQQGGQQQQQQQQQGPNGSNQERFQRLRTQQQQPPQGANSNFEQFPRPQATTANQGGFAPLGQQQQHQQAGVNGGSQRNQQLALGLPTLSAFDLSSLANLANNQPMGSNGNNQLQPTFRRIPPPSAPQQLLNQQQQQQQNQRANQPQNVPFPLSNQFFDSPATQPASSRQQQVPNGNSQPTELPFIRQVFRPAPSNGGAEHLATNNDNNNNNNLLSPSSTAAGEQQPTSALNQQQFRAPSGGRPTPPPLFVPGRQQITASGNTNPSPLRTRPLESGFSPIQPSRSVLSPDTQPPATAFFEPSQQRGNTQAAQRQPQAINRQQQQVNAAAAAATAAASQASGSLPAASGEQQQRKPAPARRPSQRPHVPVAPAPAPSRGGVANTNGPSDVIRLASNAIQAANEGLAAVANSLAQNQPAISLPDESTTPSAAPPTSTTAAAFSSSSTTPTTASGEQLATTSAASVDAQNSPPSSSSSTGRRAVSHAQPLRTSATSFFQTLTSAATASPSNFSPALPINQAIAATGGRRRIPVRNGAVMSTGQPLHHHSGNGASRPLTTTPSSPGAFTPTQQPPTTTTTATSASARQPLATTTTTSQGSSSSTSTQAAVRRPEIEEFYETIGANGNNALSPNSAAPATTLIDGFGAPSRLKPSELPPQSTTTSTTTTTAATSQSAGGGSSSTTNTPFDSDKLLTTTTDLYGSRLSSGGQEGASSPTPTSELSLDRPRLSAAAVQRSSQQQVRPQLENIPAPSSPAASSLENQNNNNNHGNRMFALDNNVQEQRPQQQQPVLVPVTYMTTLTYLTTVLHGTHTLTTSHETVERSTKMATLDARLMDQIEHKLPLIEPTATVSLSSRTKGRGTTLVNLKSAISAYNQELVEALGAANGGQIQPTQVASAVIQTTSIAPGLPPLLAPAPNAQEQQPQQASSTTGSRPQLPFNNRQRTPSTSRPGVAQSRPLRMLDLNELAEIKRQLVTEYVYSYTMRPVDQPDQVLATSVRSEMVSGGLATSANNQELASQLLAAVESGGGGGNSQAANLIDSNGMLRLEPLDASAPAQINLGSTVGRNTPQTMTEVNMNVATYLKFDGISNVLVDVRPSRTLPLSGTGGADTLLRPLTSNSSPGLSAKSQLDTSFNVHMTLGNALEQLSQQQQEMAFGSQQTPALEAASVTSLSNGASPAAGASEPTSVIKISASETADLLRSASLPGGANGGSGSSTAAMAAMAAAAAAGAALAVAGDSSSGSNQAAQLAASSSSLARSQLRSRVASSRFRTLQPSRALAAALASASVTASPVLSETIAPSSAIRGSLALRPSKSRILRPSLLRASSQLPANEISSSASVPTPVEATNSPAIVASATTRSSKPRFVVVTRTGQFGIRASAVSSLASAAASSSAADNSSPAPEPSATLAAASQPSVVRVSSRFAKPNRFRGPSQSITRLAAEQIPISATSVLQQQAASSASSGSALTPNEQSGKPLPTGTGTGEDRAQAGAANNDAAKSSPSPGLKLDGSDSVVVTYFTTTTHTIPFELNSETVFTTIEETNSRIATELMSDLSSHLSSGNANSIEPTQVASLPTIEQTAAPSLPQTTTTSSTTTTTSSSSSSMSSSTSGPSTAEQATTQASTTSSSAAGASTGAASETSTSGSESASTPSADGSQTQQRQQQQQQSQNKPVIDPSFVTTLNTRTYFTTFTYFTTYSAGSESQTVESSESTTSNVVTETITELAATAAIAPSASVSIPAGPSSSLQEAGNAQGSSAPDQVTRTLLSTMTYYGTVYNGTSSSLTPILDVSTQVLTLSGASASPGLSYLNSNDVLVASTSASGLEQPVSATGVVAPSSSVNLAQVESSVAPTPPLDSADKITRTKSMYTTLTHYITFYSGTKTQLSTIQEISPTVVTEYIDRTLFEQQQQQQAEASSSSSPVMLLVPGGSTTASTPTSGDLTSAPATTTTTTTTEAAAAGDSQKPAVTSTSTTTEQPTTTSTSSPSSSSGAQQVSESTASQTTTPSGEPAAPGTTTSEPQVESVSVSTPSRPSSESQQNSAGSGEGRVLASSGSSDQSTGNGELPVESKQSETNIIELSDLIASNSSQSGRVALAGNLGAAIKDIVQLLAGNKTTLGASDASASLHQQRPSFDNGNLASSSPGTSTSLSSDDQSSSADAAAPATTTTTSTTSTTANPPAVASNKRTNGAPARVFGNKQRAGSSSSSQSALSELHGSISSPATSSSTINFDDNQRTGSTTSAAAAAAAPTTTTTAMRATPELHSAPTNAREIAGGVQNRASPAATIFFGDDSQDERKKQVKTVWPGAQSTLYVTSVEPSTRSLTVTTTKVYYTRDAQMTVTSSYTSVIEPRTFVSTIMGTRTLVNQLGGPTQTVSMPTPPVAVAAGQPPVAASTAGGKLTSAAAASAPQRPADTQNAAVATRYKQQKQQQQQVAAEQKKQNLQLLAAKQAQAAQVQARMKLEAQQQQAAMANINQCTPACKQSANEICKFTPASLELSSASAAGTFACACRPGYYMSLNSLGVRACQEVQSYVVMLRLLQVGDQQVAFRRELANRASPEFKQFSKIVREHVKRAYMTSDLIRDRYVGSDIINYARTLSVSSGTASSSLGATPTSGRAPLAINSSQLDPLNAGVIVNMTIHLQAPSGQQQQQQSQANSNQGDTSAPLQVDESMLKEELTKKLNMRQAAALAAAAAAAASAQPGDTTANNATSSASSGAGNNVAQADQPAAVSSATGSNATSPSEVAAEMLPNPNALFLADVEQVQDLDECASPSLNDCHEGATCINEPGSYRCDCREYPDLNPLRPGRQCANELKSCDFCNNRGDCLRVPSMLGSVALNGTSTTTTNAAMRNGQTSGSFSTVCQCHRLFMGRYCEINGLLLSTLLPIVAILLIISVSLIIFCCRRWRRRSAMSKGFRNIGAFGPNHHLIGGTLDRKAMLESSSESSDTHQRAHHQNHHAHQQQLSNGGGVAAAQLHHHPHLLRSAANGGQSSAGNLYDASEPSSSQESSPRQMSHRDGAGVTLPPPSSLAVPSSANSYLAGQSQASPLNPYCSSIPPQIVIPRARHNQVNYAVHRGQVYMW